MSEPTTRRDFIKTAGFAALGTLLGCSKDRKPPATPYVEAGNLAIYYGKADADVLSALQNTTQCVVEPYYIAAENAPRGAFAYGALVAVNTLNDGLADLRAQLEAADGYLLQGDAPQMDPAGANSRMVDLRKPEAFAAMKAHLLGLGQAYPKGLFLDTLDSAIAVEQHHPGLTAAAIRLVAELRAALPGKTLILNGGLEQAPGETLTQNSALAALIPQVDALAVESQHFELPDRARPKTSHEWTIARLRTAAIAAKSAGKSLELWGLEPCIAQHADRGCEAAQSYQQWASTLTQEGYPTRVALYLSDHSYQKPQDIAANLSLRGQTICR